jgi:alpha-D-ribose 1-methylphosphonate 5-triphosphate synthase subunit PhnH
MGSEARAVMNQEIFRKLMGAMSRPGRLFRLGTVCKEPLMDILNVLLDHEVGFCVTGADSDTLGRLINAETGAKAVDISQADYVITPAEGIGDELFRAKMGSLEYPDKGATIIYYGAKPAENGKFIFAGPGVPDGGISFDPGIPDDEIKKLAEINSGFPLGVDAVIVCEKPALICMPRSLKITGGK